MGGISSVRGYDPYSFPDRGIEKYKSIKALKSFTNSIEASIPLSEKAKLRLTGFVDYGWIGTERIDNIADRGGYGMVIEWLSPMAPIQFVFARTFNDKETDSTSRFEFMLGRRF
jgi:outer membrane protein insertion porin family